LLSIQQSACRKSVLNAGGHLASIGDRLDAQRMGMKRRLPMLKAAPSSTMRHV
jgi:hypothetical protein